MTSTLSPSGISKSNAGLSATEVGCGVCLKCIDAQPSVVLELIIFHVNISELTWSQTTD